MSANYEQIKRSVNAEATMKSDQFIQLQENSGRYVYKPANYYAYNDKRVISSISANSSVPASLSNAVVDFKIENSVVDVMQYPSLDMQFTNSSGVALTAVATPLWINHIEVYGNNGSTLLANITGDDLFMQYFFLDRSTYEAQCTAIGLTTAYANAGTSIANGASLELNLPLYHLFKAIHLANCGLRSGLLLRFFFANAITTYLTGGPLVCNGLNLVVRGKSLKQDAKRGLLELYSDRSRIPISLPHLAIDRVQITQPLQAGQVVPIVLTAPHGVCSFLIFTVRLASDVNTPNNQTNYIRMQDWDILDASNKSLIGALRRNINVQQIDYANNWGNNAWANSNFHIMCWSNLPRESFASGTNSGFCILTGNEKLSFTCPSTLASATYLIEVKCYMHANILVEKGTLRLERD